MRCFRSIHNRGYRSQVAADKLAADEWPEYFSGYSMGEKEDALRAGYRADRQRSGGRDGHRVRSRETARAKARKE